MTKRKRSNSSTCSESISPKKSKRKTKNKKRSSKKQDININITLDLNDVQKSSVSRLPDNLLSGEAKVLTSENNEISKEDENSLLKTPESLDKQQQQFDVSSLSKKNCKSHRKRKRSIRQAKRMGKSKCKGKSNRNSILKFPSISMFKNIFKTSEKSNTGNLENSEVSPKTKSSVEPIGTSSLSSVNENCNKSLQRSMTSDVSNGATGGSSNQSDISKGTTLIGLSNSTIQSNGVGLSDSTTKSNKVGLFDSTTKSNKVGLFDSTTKSNKVGLSDSTTKSNKVGLSDSTTKSNKLGLPSSAESSSCTKMPSNKSTTIKDDKSKKENITNKNVSKTILNDTSNCLTSSLPSTTGSNIKSHKSDSVIKSGFKDTNNISTSSGTCFSTIEKAQSSCNSSKPTMIKNENRESDTKRISDKKERNVTDKVGKCSNISKSEVNTKTPINSTLQTKNVKDNKNSMEKSKTNKNPNEKDNSNSGSSEKEVNSTVCSEKYFGISSLENAKNEGTFNEKSLQDKPNKCSKEKNIENSPQENIVTSTEKTNENSSSIKTVSNANLETQKPFKSSSIKFELENSYPKKSNLENTKVYENRSAFDINGTCTPLSTTESSCSLSKTKCEDRSPNTEKCTCTKFESSKKDNQSVFTETCPVCFKNQCCNSTNNKNMKKGIENKNLFGTPKTKIEKDKDSTKM